MIRAEQIPDSAAFALDDARKDPDASPWDLISAAINAWPKMGTVATEDHAGVWRQIILPLTQDERGMSDIVERLKSGTCGQGCGTMTECICATAEDAADEITRLRAEVEKLKADLAYADSHAAKVEDLLWGTAKENEKLKAARDLVLEEAARVAEKMLQSYTTMDDTPAAIRALKNKTGDTHEF